MSKIKILYVDDEIENLNSFKANFRREYEVYIASSAKEALKILDTKMIQIIVSDQRMPEITGVELFKEIKNKYPDPVRVLLTGYTDIDILAEAVNEGHIFRYLTKPWNHIELETCIKNAYDYYLATTNLKQKVQELQKINADLNRFIYSISHELRAPIASALGIISLAKLENCFNNHTPESEYWMMIDKCCNKLDENLSSMIQYYKSSRYKTVSEEISFEKIVGNLVHLHKSAHLVNGEIRFVINIFQPVLFFGDKFRIEIILSNFISNAIKYQNPVVQDKLIEINIQVSEENVIIKISDNGIGISEKEKEKIFEQFFRGNHHSGIGLGLFIAHEALTKINGHVLLKSEIGSTFTITIPNQKVKQPAVAV